MAVWIFGGMETGLQQKGGSLVGSRVVASSGVGGVDITPKRSWVRELEEHKEGLERR